MPLRNPFSKRPDGHSDDSGRPSSQNGTLPTFERVDTVGSKAPSSLSIGSSTSREPLEYKMSVVNDSGVYLPPSPPEKKSFWPRRSNASGTSLSTRASEPEIDPFPITRESFDSYRRSFDISARSPAIPSDHTGRQSLDAARMPRLPRSAINERKFERQPPTAEEGFEDVGLNDEQVKQPKKRGFFSKFSESAEPTQSPAMSKFHFGGRRRGQSGTGEELGSIQKPNATGKPDEEQ